MILLDKMATVEYVYYNYLMEIEDRISFSEYFLIGPFCRYNLSAGTSEKVQLGALLGAFQTVRDIVVKQA